MSKKTHPFKKTDYTPLPIVSCRLTQCLYPFVCAFILLFHPWLEPMSRRPKIHLKHSHFKSILITFLFLCAYKCLYLAFYCLFYSVLLPFCFFYPQTCVNVILLFLLCYISNYIYSSYLLILFYFPLSYEKQFELPLCEKCAIEINFPCLLVDLSPPLNPTQR